ncbi:FAD-binding oxidoreductase [Anianabacter salinae]|uniref:FAD-binding oxidoreductase n=1 Tax=Anianabacter salinae TaxID=2851023 RepID=UPI00225E0C9D|nr:FAD-binding oxidoreductase [Anianabacter salinae]MBV0913692.1 flavodoxin reductase [Anianabacter salinae]
MTHTLTLHSIEPVTHDVNRLRFDKPAGYDFTPGQATELAVDKDGWRDEQRPFTFTSLPGDDFLEFTIKSYPSHDGVTEQIGKLTKGDTVLIEDAWGAIEDKGDGVFIAGGAGVTPFISILRARDKAGKLNPCTLIFSNKTEADIILQKEWEAMQGLGVLFTLTDEDKTRFRSGQIDKDLLRETVAEWEQYFYICGPKQMVKDISATLTDLGVPEAKIVHEDLG